MTEIYRTFNKGDRVKLDPNSLIYKTVHASKADRLGTIITGNILGYSYTVRWDGRKSPVTIYCNYLIKVSE